MESQLIISKNDQQQEWDGVWKEEKFINKIVNVGRKVYNFRLMMLLKKYIDSGTRFCELGCGGSSLLAKMASHTKKVIGIDYSKSAIEISQQKFEKRGIENYEFIKDNVLDLKTRKKFDVVWSQGLIEHFEDPAKVVKAHIDLTKKKGHTIISVPYKYSYIFLWRLVTKPKILNMFWPWTEQTFFTKKTLKKSLEKYCPEQDDYKIILYPVFGLVILVVRKK